MTLNLTAITPQYVCQVSDRRLIRVSRNGKIEIYTDQANKSTLLVCKDAAVAVTYCGIGESRSERTDLWLVKALQKSKPFHNSIFDVLREFREQSSEWMKQLRHNFVGSEENLRHTFIFAGWLNEIKPIIFYESNFENLVTNEEATRPWPEFVGTLSKSPYSVHSGGDDKSLRKEDVQLLIDVIQKPSVKPKDVINIMVRTIQNAAEDSKVIGKNCMSTLLLPGKPGVQCDNHFSSGKSTSYLPNIVSADSLWDVEVFSGEGTPPWKIREFIPSGMTKTEIVKGLRILPVGYRTGDALPENLDPRLAKFLRALPEGTTEQEIIDTL